MCRGITPSLTSMYAASASSTVPILNPPRSGHGEFPVNEYHGIVFERLRAEFAGGHVFRIDPVVPPELTMGR